MRRNAHDLIHTVIKGNEFLCWIEVGPGVTHLWLCDSGRVTLPVIPFIPTAAKQS